MQVANLNRGHISVREKWEIADKFSTEKAWEYISEVESMDVKNNISPLRQAISEDENAKRFDLLMHAEFLLLEEVAE